MKILSCSIDEIVPSELFSLILLELSSSDTDLFIQGTDETIFLFLGEKARNHAHCQYVVDEF